MPDQDEPETTVEFLVDNAVAADLPGYDTLMRHAQEAGMYEEVLEALRGAFRLGMDAALGGRRKEPI